MGREECVFFILDLRASGAALKLIKDNGIDLLPVISVNSPLPGLDAKNRTPQLYSEAIGSTRPNASSNLTGA